MLNLPIPALTPIGRPLHNNSTLVAVKHRIIFQIQTGQASMGIIVCLVILKMAISIMEMEVAATRAISLIILIILMATRTFNRMVVILMASKIMAN